METTSKQVTLGLLGTGGRLRGVVRRLLESAPAGSLRVKAAYDPRADSHATLRTVIGDDYEVAPDEDAVINDPEIDWILIGSWNCHHARQASAALRAGKHVFCEKPLATTLEDCLAIRDAVESSGKQFIFGLVLRYSRHYQKIREVIDSGKLGKIISFEFNETLSFNHGGYIFGNWRRKVANAGTHLLEKCCHDLDLANWMAGSLPVRVASFGGRDFFTPANRGQIERIGTGPKGEEPFATWRDTGRTDPFDGGPDIFDNQVAILQYANGIRATFHTNCHTAIQERRFYLCGSEGTLRADLITGQLELRRIGWETETETVETIKADGHGGGDNIMAEALADSILHGTAPLASIREGLQSAITAFGIDRAADEGTVVDLTPLWCQAGIDPHNA
ncbi:MAG TPA: Gfo/Idh/MocA family oxidoreductase [Chthoniobacteraceae bacterium]|nr:Gfo/Idh/MocA family oxidoreductase [Chthoniobacteraceae bacterium]